MKNKPTHVLFQSPGDGDYGTICIVKMENGEFKIAYCKQGTTINQCIKKATNHGSTFPTDVSNEMIPIV